ncbi:phosphonoacetaldehyde hydrolase [[Actinomadura] parvosata subsp. kistnae]|uniref:HAD family hydrolase n=1 Tax=[Actinomadura] parvosata subsp. kistnae TaxID=1909395 RepID=A0A1U9ZRV2_9ACTN|nr:phosphonatase-like hydrolase [Nonomuraea sp. ATCC 55076]AQZ60674.1 HAD family hydrolase [Nonomuraea sp. ATCC 55076]SPL90726.1 phosphonoacetaldehyde hydrolase [Actinomadura parvosata subsp. kistnae]
MIELAVLDIAGTTVEEHGAVYLALEEAVRAAGGTPSAADIERWMGADKREAIAALLTGSPTGGPSRETSGGPSGETIDAAFADFRARLRAAYAARPPAPLPGVPEAIGTLRAAGVKVALTTGFDREVTTELLKVVGWEHGVLDAVVCVDDVTTGRPAPYMIFRAMEATGVHDVGRVLTAGDTVRDLEAGTNAGARVVAGVLTGSQDAATLGAVRHTHLLPGVASIPALLSLA